MPSRSRFRTHQAKVGISDGRLSAEGVNEGDLGDLDHLRKWGNWMFSGYPIDCSVAASGVSSMSAVLISEHGQRSLLVHFSSMRVVVRCKRNDELASTRNRKK